MISRLAEDFTVLAVAMTGVVGARPRVGRTLAMAKVAFEVLVLRLVAAAGRDVGDCVGQGQGQGASDDVGF